MEAKLVYTRDDLLDFGILELTHYARRNDCVNLVIFVAVGLFEYIDGVKDIGFVHDCAKRALIDARAARHAFVVVNHRLFVGIHGNGVDLAAAHTRAMLMYERVVRTHLSALSALYALFLVDDRAMIDDGNRALGTLVRAAVEQTASASVGDENAAYGALVARLAYDLHHVGVVPVAAHRQLDALSEYGALLVNTAAQLRLGAGRKLFGYVKRGALQISLVSAPDYLF
jgi:hypothetical protein